MENKDQDLRFNGDLKGNSKIKTDKKLVLLSVSRLKKLFYIFYLFIPCTTNALSACSIFPSSVFHSPLSNALKQRNLQF